MKKFDKKGFTIVELVIVIAVIAILAGIMIPTFSNVTETAKQTAVSAKAAELYKNAYALDMADGYQDGKDTKDAAVDAQVFTDTATEIFTYTVDATATPAEVTVTYQADGYVATLQADGTWVVTDAE